MYGGSAHTSGTATYNMRSRTAPDTSWTAAYNMRSWTAPYNLHNDIMGIPHNHRENQKKPKKPKRLSQKHSKTIEKTRNTQKILRVYRDKDFGQDCQPCSLRTLMIFWDFMVFSMVLLCFWLSLLGFFCFFWFSQWFCFFV